MSGDRAFLDSNVCLYLLSEDSPKKQKAEELLALPDTVII
jgi:predicted nucleic acid-binding protein